jgi:transcriptional regulator with XRE-family HTH domain
MSVRQAQNLDRLERAKEWSRKLIHLEQDRSGLSYREAAKRVARRIQTTASEISRLAHGGLSRISINTFFALSEAFERDLLHEAARLQTEIDLCAAARRHIDPAAIDQARALLAQAQALLNEVRDDG